jgi:hypothetical protein
MSNQRRWYQFTTRRILGATLWLAVGMGTFVALNRGQFENGIQTLSAVMFFFICPYIAAGTLIGHALRWFAIGVASITLFIVAINTIPGAQIDPAVANSGWGILQTTLWLGCITAVVSWLSRWLTLRPRNSNIAP